MRARWRRGAAVAALVAVLTAPALWPGRPDTGFPLSTYPMFASARGRQVAVATAVGVGAGGEVRRLDPATIGGTGEAMLAATTVGRAVRAGGGDLDRLCIEIAGRLGGDGEIVAVELRTETHDAVAWFDGAHVPSHVSTHARCEVPG